MGDLSERAERSVWLGDDAPLTAAVQGWERHLADERATVAAHAARLARPGPLPVLRTLQHQGALLRAQLSWATTRLPRLARPGAAGFDAVRHPRRELEAAMAHVVREHLARLGPSAAAIARLIEESAGMAPDTLVGELRRRPIEITPLPRSVILDSLSGLVREQIADLGPVTAVRPISQAHASRLHDGTRASLHVRRPGADQLVREDARILATMLTGLELAVPAARVAHPLGLLEVITVQLLEENDLRNEALNAVELGLAVEALGLTSLVVARPLPLLVAPEAAGFESFPHAQRLAELPAGGLAPDALGDLARLVVEGALSLGVFPADLHRDRFTAVPDGRLVVTGCSAIGRLDATIRRGMIDLMVAMLGADAPGQVKALVEIGAAPADADLAGLERDLAAVAPPDLFLILAGMMPLPVEAMNGVIELAVRHRLRPPIELMLFGRTVLALNAVIERVEPDRTLQAVLLPLMMRLPEWRAALDAS
jgi:ubiquinone biosynthesis protein